MIAGSTLCYHIWKRLLFLLFSEKLWISLLLLVYLILLLLLTVGVCNLGLVVSHVLVVHFNFWCRGYHVRLFVYHV